MMPTSTPHVEVNPNVYSKRSQSLKKKNSTEDIVVTLLVIPPDGGWGWMVLAASFLINFIMDGTIYSLGLFLDDIADYMGTYPTRVAYASSILVGVNLLTAPIICGLTNKYGFRQIAFTGGIMATTVLMVSSFIKDLNTFLFVLGVFGGLACALIYVPTVVIVGFYFERWRALASALSICGSSCGIIFFPLILNNLLAGYHWTVKFRILSISFLFVSLFSLAFKPLPPVSVRPDPEQDDSYLSIYLGGDHRAILSQMYSSYHNRLYPTIEVPEGSPQTITNIKKDFSSSSTLVAASSCPGGSITAVSKMSTVFEDEIKLTVCERCRKFLNMLHNCKLCCCPGRIRAATSTISRPMYRDDIFFTGSIYNLAGYPKNPSIKCTVSSIKGTVSKKSAIDYHLSVTRVATQKDLDEESKTFVCCPEALKRILAAMLDFRLLKSPSFLCLSISGFLVSLGMYIPFVYIVHKAIENNIEHKLAGMMVTGLGVANLCGRILSGVLGSIPQVNALVVTYVGLFIAGIPSIIFALVDDPWIFYVYIALYGTSIATVPSMKTIILVDLLGLEKLTNAFGITLMFQGLSTLISLPAAGYFIECTNSYNASFIFCGCAIILSGIMLIPIRCIKLWEMQKN